MKPLKDYFGDEFETIEFVNADCLDKASIDKAIEGSQFVVHTASPVPTDGKITEDEIV